MSLPNNYPFNEYVVSAYLADLSTSSSTYAAAPVTGKIVRAYSAIGAAITGADSTWTMAINGTAVTGVSVVVANSGSAAGDIDTGIPTAANHVVDGDTITFTTDGASSTTCPTMFYAVIRT